MSAPFLDHDPVRLEGAPLTRRRFLALLSTAALGAALSACRSEDAIEATAVVPASLPPTTDVDEGSQTPEPGGSPAAGTAPPTAAAGSVTLEQFMRMSQVLTAFDDLNDTSNGETYLAALNRQTELGTALGELWEQGGFADGQAASVADLEAAGVYDDATLAELADTITRYWYTGIYDTGPDTVEVATFTQALAWRTLGYRQTGPTTCTGAFGSWATAPATS